jgi:AraC-like DNA-binding protein
MTPTDPDLATTVFVNALQVAVLVGQTGSVDGGLDAFAALVETIPTGLGPHHLLLLRAVLIVHFWRWIRAVAARDAPVILDALSNAFSNPDLRAAFRDVLGVIRERAGRLRERKNPTDPRVIDALAYIRAHCAEHPLLLTTVARGARASRWHLEKLLKKHTGKTFREVLLEARMEKAAALLECGNLSVKEVAGRLGYSYASDLTRDFKKAAGVSPREWRRLHTRLPARASCLKS